MTKTDRVRVLLEESKKLKKAGHTDGAYDKLWSAVDWLCDCIDDEATERDRLADKVYGRDSDED
jgi:hypothetical protein